MFLLPNQPLCSRDLLWAGLKLWRKDFKILFWLMLGTVVVAFAPYIIYSYIKPEVRDASLLFLWQYPDFILIELLFTAFTFSAIFYRVYMFIYDKKGGTKKAAIMALQRLPYAFVTLVSALFLITLGCLFFVIPGIILMYYLSMALPLVIIDKENPIYALEKSYLLVKNHWWHTFGTMVLSLMPFWIFSFLIYFSLTSVGMVMFYRNVLQLILGVIYYPYFCSMLLLLFHDLKLRKGIKKF